MSRAVQLLLACNDSDCLKRFFALQKPDSVILTTVDSAQKTLDTLRGGKYDVAVIDMRLPGVMTEDRLLPQIAKELPDVPVIVLADRDTSREIVIKALELGATDYICSEATEDEIKLRVLNVAEKDWALRQNRLTEIKMCEQHARMKTILNSMDELVFLFDAAGRFTDQYCKDPHLAIPVAEFLGKKHSEVMPAEIHRKFMAAVEQNKAGEIAEYEYALTISGQVRHWYVSLSPIMQAGEYKGSVAVAKDITDTIGVEEMVLAAVEKENIRTGSLLYNQLGQSLKGASLMCEALYKSLKELGVDQTRVAKEIINALEVAQEQVFLIALGLCPVFLGGGLAESLKRLCGHYKKGHGVECSLESDCDQAFPDSRVELNLFRIVHEAMMNAQTHTGAKKLSISLKLKDGTGVLSVESDGRRLTNESEFGNNELGWELMKRRAAAIGAELVITPGNTEGARVLCTFRLQ